MLAEAERLIRELDEARQETRAILATIDTEQEVYTGWTIRHFLAHLTGWDEATIASLRAHATGKEPGTPAYRGIDFYNQQSVDERIDLSYRQVLAECELAREDLKEIIRALPEGKFKESLVLPWGQTGTVNLLVGIMIHHEKEHAEEITKLLGIPSAAPNQSGENTQAAGLQSPE